MVLLDDRILELLNEEGPHSPGEIAEDDRIPYGVQHIRNRCKELYEHGLVQKAGRGTYFISDRGIQYLEGGLNAGELEADSEEENGATEA